MNVPLRSGFSCGDVKNKQVLTFILWTYLCTKFRTTIFEIYPDFTTKIVLRYR